MFDDQTHCAVVVGAQWGDEGKGKLVDVLAEQADFVVRYQGGANAGHTVVTGDSQFILRQIPSGILHPRATCVIGNGVVVDPVTLFSELDALTERGVATDGRMFVSNRAHLVLPFHKLLDAASEKSQGIGTTGKGIGPAYEDKIGRRGVRVGDLRDMGRVRGILEQRVARANQMLEMMHATERASLDEHVELLSGYAPRLNTLAADTGLLLHRALRAGKRILLEGAQGSLLDLDHGTYPFVTSSSTTAGGAAVGAGPFPTELTGEQGEWLRKTGHEYGVTTGRPRRTGWFDAVIARYATRVNGITDYFLTKLDVLSGLERVPVCVAYQVNGQRYDEVPMTQTDFHHAVPVYEYLGGWWEDISAAKEFDDLPRNAQAYVRTIEGMIGAPLCGIGVGPRRDQTLQLRPLI